LTVKCLPAARTETAKEGEGVDDSVTDFRLEVPEEVLSDLRSRLRNTRWPEQQPVKDWSQGMPLDELQELCRYWAEDYDWRATEQRLNKLAQRLTTVDGLVVHLLDVRSPEPGALPLVMTHGWPGSVVEFLDVLGPLTDPRSHGGDPRDAFHLVCPSLPGYGFSGKPKETGWGVDRTARTWAKVMARLGHDRYGAQGGDWGALVTASLGRQDADHIVGIHLNMPIAAAPKGEAGDREAEPDVWAARRAYERTGDGYAKQQSTFPQTLGYGLVDSPAAQCAWIVEKFHAWTDHDGDLYDLLTRDQLLDNVMLYWLPATGASSARMYWESFRQPDLADVGVPTGISVFRGEIYRVPRSWCERRFTDLRSWRTVPRGGHFAAFEQPALFIDEVRAFFRDLR